MCGLQKSLCLAQQVLQNHDCMSEPVLSREQQNAQDFSSNEPQHLTGKRMLNNLNLREVLYTEIYEVYNKRKWYKDVVHLDLDVG